MDMVLPRVDAWSAEHVEDEDPSTYRQARRLRKDVAGLEQLNRFGKAAEL
jgi:hypothetical protein